jgi:hypothetical protein
MWISGACLVHCLALPLVVAVLPLWSLGDALHAWLHPVFALLLIPTTLFAMRSGYREHRLRHILVLLGGGLALVLVAGVLGHLGPGERLETGFTLLGSSLLVTGHWRNYQFCSRCGATGRRHACSTPSPEPHATPQLHAERRYRTAS